MSKYDKLIKRVDQLIQKGENVLKTNYHVNGASDKMVDSSQHYSFRVGALSFIENLYGINHSFFMEFKNRTDGHFIHSTRRAIAMLCSIKDEIESGWYDDFKGLVAADIFGNFLDMAEYLLDKTYKDAAAVIIGSTLENHMRYLCDANGIDVTTIDRKGKTKSKKADTLNSELMNRNVYTKTDLKAVTAWLDIRNNAAHGDYNEYTKEQVELMYQGVTEFISRVK